MTDAENMAASIRTIAAHRALSPPSTWPDHNGSHRRTLQGDWLQDDCCLRCQLEKYAARAIDHASHALAELIRKG